MANPAATAMTMQIQELAIAASRPALVDPGGHADRKLATPHNVKTTTMKPSGTYSAGGENGIPFSIPILTISRIPARKPKGIAVF
jgi:hypothetical protein